MQLFITCSRVGEPGNEATRHELIILLNALNVRLVHSWYLFGSLVQHVFVSVQPVLWSQMPMDSTV